MEKLIHFTYRIFAAFFLMLAMGCEKFVDAGTPVTATVSDVVYSSDESATSVLTGLYTDISAGDIVFPGTVSSLSLFLGLSADELTLSPLGFEADREAYYTNSLGSNVSGFEYWKKFYGYIFRCNDAIENLNKVQNLTPAVKQQLLGEAAFMRAFLYFYLVNLYGDAPLVTSTDYKATSSLARSSKDDINKQIISDLRQAQDLLSSDYLDGKLQPYTGGTEERVRPTKWAATAQLAREYLYTGDWQNAELQSTALINNQPLYDTVPLNEAFLKNNKEAIWQLQSVSNGPTANTFDAVTFIIPPTGLSASNPVYLSDQLLNSFEPGDQRMLQWVNSTDVSGTNYYYVYKYKENQDGAPVTEYLTILRLGEQYLIRAEARAQLANLSGADADLNVIRTRAGLPAYASVDKNSSLAAILHERQTELFIELGARWLDIKRTATVDAIMPPVLAVKEPGLTWQSYKQWFPLPLSDLKNAPNIHQNAGY
ncbi:MULTISPECIES: RagB/SusD family nutrient uptake outer membrane protein [Niastella]|uniref:RagB/SusD family nutrient uptake outer membrane protein n=1 Tax=Niastella soli TaxID=2821487 RepID=A0ABS3Z3A1_9BACT|nr:RagB/SusD family nutrient uptake outer membrane protein [Niastella soli]MBO9204653.1 RagB/SusD family nutrient uptake outer membrane protein [Niastella soli]